MEFWGSFPPFREFNNDFTLSLVRVQKVTCWPSPSGASRAKVVKPNCWTNRALSFRSSTPPDKSKKQSYPKAHTVLRPSQPKILWKTPTTRGIFTQSNNVPFSGTWDNVPIS